MSLAHSAEEQGSSSDPDINQTQARTVASQRDTDSDATWLNPRSPKHQQEEPRPSGPILTKFGRYELRAQLGRRGDFVVYLANDPQLRREITIKVLSPELVADDQFRARFRHELELIVALEHPAIVQIYDFGEHRGQPYAVMPYLSGGTLAARLTEQPLSPEALMTMINRLAPALDEAHGRGVIHRRITPYNILFDAEDKAYLSDFGLAVPIKNFDFDTPAAQYLLHYLSPEQITALTSGTESLISPTSDIYSLGVVFFEALTGQPPYRAGTAHGLAEAHHTAPIPNITEIRPALSSAYQTVINRSLAKEPAHRYTSAGEFARQVQQAATGRWYLNRLLDLGDEVTDVPPPETIAELQSHDPESVVMLGRYHLVGRLGKGGMGVVYLAFDPDLKRQVAIKILPPRFTKAPEFQVRFRREAGLVAQLQHKSIVSVYDFGESDSTPYIVMQYLSGGTLSEQLKEGPLKPRQLAPIIRRVAEALDEAHQRHIIHQDVKPANILFNAEGQAYLSDFGIAVISEAAADVSGGNTVGGTPRYMSPEQVRAFIDATPKNLDGRSDVYSLGVVLFEAVTGDLPFDDETNNARKIALSHITQPIPRLQEKYPSLAAAGLQEIIDKALAKDPAMRYATPTALAEDFAEFAGGRWFLRKLVD